MDWEDVWKVMGAALFSLGGGGIIVFALSSWLGKVWAGRILGKETHRLALELESARRELDLIKENTLRFQNDKLNAYREVIDMVARLLAAFDSRSNGTLEGAAAIARFDEFNEQRIRVYGYLVMVAPQSVMDAQDSLIDYLLTICHGKAVYEWHTVREKALLMLNTVREDIGIGKDPITYKGAL